MCLSNPNNWGGGEAKRKDRKLIRRGAASEDAGRISENHPKIGTSRTRRKIGKSVVGGPSPKTRALSPQLPKIGITKPIRKIGNSVVGGASKDAGSISAHPKNRETVGTWQMNP